MRLLVIGSGGREHALAWKLSQSSRVEKVYVAPGNFGSSLEPKLENLALTDINLLIDFAKQQLIDFTLVGPEIPLANGIVDKFREHGLKIWGPTKFCAQLESSKSFAKDFMTKYKIPTAKYAIFTEESSAKQYLTQQQIPIVIKADGLAAGKGVLVANSLDEGLSFIEDVFSKNKFGTQGGNKVVIEEFLAGEEASFIVMIDGKNILALASSQDHKRLLNNDLGPNTGGMGAYSPAPIVTNELHQRVIKEIIQPVIDGMHNEGHEYSGFLYAGLMIASDGTPKTLEYNCRCGDPETQPIMLRLKSDLVTLIEAGLNQELNKVSAEWEDKVALGVVLASNGYPDAPQTKDIIYGLDNVNRLAQVKVFHASTAFDNNKICTAGGRVLCVVGLGDNLQQAQKNTYNVVKQINFAGMQYRTDIGNKAL